MIDSGLRASDADRERVVSVLRTQAGEGRLTLEELSERSAAAYAARTVGELDALTSDLPVSSSPPEAPAPVSRWWVPLAAIAVLLVAVALLALAGLASAGGMGQMMAKISRMCG